MEQESAGKASTQARGGQTHYATLIRLAMAKGNVTVDRLLKEGIIRRSTSRDFDYRVQRGILQAAEFSRLLDYLGIDPLRAHLALACLNKPDAYFDPTCETASLVASAMFVSLHEQISACEGNFEPIRESLCRSLAEQTSEKIVNHHKRVEERRAAAIA